MFVAGATGVLGRRLVAQFAERGHDVVGLARDDAGERLVSERGGTPRRGDVLDPASLEGAVDAPEVLVHAATAIPTGRKPGAAEWERNDRVRREGLSNLLAAADDGALERVLFPSVVWVARRPDGSPFDEDAPRHPTRATASAADVEERLAAAAADRGFERTVLRCGYLYAPDAAHTRQFGENLLARRMPVVGRGVLGRRDAALSLVHADDAAAAFADAVDAGASGLYHVVDDEPVTLAAMLREFADLLDAPEPRRVPAWLARYVVGADAARLLSSPMPTASDRFREATGWEPAYPTYRDGLRQVVETWRTEGVIREADRGFAWTA